MVKSMFPLPCASLSLLDALFVLTLSPFVTPAEWQDERPPAPSYLRILYLGKILQDEETLSSTSHPSPQADSEPDKLSSSLSLYSFACSIYSTSRPDLPVHHYNLRHNSTCTNNHIPPTSHSLATHVEWAFPITQPDPSAPSPQATVVHLSVRSVPPPTEDAPKKRRGFGAGPGDEEGGACGCCGCVIC